MVLNGCQIDRKCGIWEKNEKEEKTSINRDDKDNDQ